MGDTTWLYWLLQGELSNLWVYAITNSNKLSIHVDICQLGFYLCINASLCKDSYHWYDDEYIKSKLWSVHGLNTSEPCLHLEPRAESSWRFSSSAEFRGEADLLCPTVIHEVCTEGFPRWVSLSAITRTQHTGFSRTTVKYAAFEGELKGPVALEW